MNEIVHFKSIGKVVSPVKQPLDEKWGHVISEIHLKPEFARGLTGLETFSHVLVLFYMHQSTWDPEADMVRRPQGRSDMPMIGIFAQRAKHRPNAIGTTAVQLISVKNNVVTVKGLDAVDGTPVLDIKPYYPAYDRVDKPIVPEWVDRLMKNYFAAAAPAPELKKLVTVSKPALIRAAGEVPKDIEEFFGRLNSKTEEVSIARMKSPAGWSEPGQTPEFDEYSVVLKGVLRVSTKDKIVDLQAGQGVLVRKSEWIQYSTPYPEGAEYISVCLPAFSPDLVHRDEQKPDSSENPEDKSAHSDGNPA